MKKPVAKPTTHVFRITLKPRITRDIEIGSGRSLYDLAEAINVAYGFMFDHAFGFYSNLTGNVLRSPVSYELFADLEETDSEAGSVKRTTVAEAFPKVGSKMTFLFDYGDEWHFRVEVLDRGTKAGRSLAKVLDGVGKAPEQYPEMDDDDDFDDEDEDEDEDGAP
ncbi:MAG: hypothetical protein P4L71_22410 [Acetobacteraceae bacterium]|nr:hypothetical protein [Acetobacteraceae bacterium]